MQEKHPSSHNVAKSLAHAVGQHFDFNTWSPIAGGSMHQSWKVTTASGQHFFVKTNHKSLHHVFKTEALGLHEIQQHISIENPLRVPKVYTTGCDTYHAWLILEFIPFQTSSPQSDGRLGQALALLHLQSSNQPTHKPFGLNYDNFIGHNIQHNQYEENWFMFFAQQRLATQIQLTKTNGFYHQLAQEAETVMHILPLAFEGYRPAPSLLHGDLWSGNKACDAHNNPMIFDPAIYYGDRECDLAMTELFSGFAPDFYTAYHEVYPIHAGYQQRKHVYNLYHLLNHANLFRGAYIQQSKQTMRQIITSFGHTI